jgi:hypothetical protein
MERPATWKILTLGMAVTGLSFMGAGAALADSGATAVQPLRVSAANAPVIPLDPPWWDDDMAIGSTNFLFLTFQLITSRTARSGTTTGTTTDATAPITATVMGAC